MNEAAPNSTAIVGSVSTSYVDELRLTAFKSFRDSRLPLSRLTLLIGRNGSGKSNALDGLEVLSRLAAGDDVRDALEGGRRDTGPVRGGVEGCAPRGADGFTLGCTVRTGTAVVTLDVTIQVAPQVQVVSEKLSGPTRVGQRVLLETVEADPNSGDIEARWWNGRRGRNPSLQFRATRLLTSQVPIRVPAGTTSAQEVHRAAEQVMQALGGVFHLDPVPHLMRQYVQERDVVLRRTAENLSAVVRHLKATDKDAFAQLRGLLSMLPEHSIKDLIVERSSLGDVMLATRERQGGKDVVIPARLISDGMLRFLAIATALLSAATPETVGRVDAESGRAGRTLVIEELENGLHPSQAARLLTLLVEQGEARGVHTLATTHSPALLNALAGDQHEGVIVCDRDPRTGLSRLRPLPEIPAYATAMAGGPLGDVVTKGLLGQRETDRGRDFAEFERLIGVR